MVVRKPIRSQLIRHSIKQKGTPTGLSPEGEAAARAAGLALPRAYRVKGRHSESPRAKSTLELGLQAFSSTGGKIYKKTPVRKRLGLERIIFDEAGWMEVESKIGEAAAVRHWIDGKFPASVALPAQKVADGIIRHELKFGSYLSKRGARGILLRNQTHSGTIEAVFERLTGVKFETIPPGTMVNPNEGLTLTHSPNGMVTLQYRGRIFDVTKRFNEIVSRK